MSTPPSVAMNFNDFPKEIMLKIFSYFTQKEIKKSLAAVCTEWCRVCKDPSFWKSLRIDISPEKSVKAYRELIASCQSSLRSLTLHMTFPRHDVKEYISNFQFDNLKELVISGSGLLDDEDMFSIVSSAPKVEILSINARSGIIGLRHISSLKNLKSLTLADHIFRDVDRQDIEHIVKECTKREALLLKVLYLFDDEFLVLLVENRRETLKHLIISRDYYTHDGINALATCQNLSTLCFRGYCSPLTKEILSAVSTMQKLEWLDLGRNAVTEPQTWTNFFRCPNLSSLKILQMCDTHIDDNGVVSVATTCKKLVILDVAQNHNLHDAGVQTVIDNCSELFFFNISDTQVTSDILLPCVANKLPHLKYFNLQMCRGIDEMAMDRFALMCPGVNIMKNYGQIYVEYMVDKSLNLKWQF